MRSDEPAAPVPSDAFAPFDTATLPRWSWYAGGTALVACVAVVGYAMTRRPSVPPAASGSVTASCRVPGFTFRAHAYFESDGHRWRISHYLYRITADGTGNVFGGAHRGIFNNVEAIVVSDGRRAAPKLRDDDQPHGRLVRVPAGTMVARSKRTDVHFRAISDQSAGLLSFFAPDPECAAVTPPLPRLPASY
jgi:hypothetical protein